MKEIDEVMTLRSSDYQKALQIHFSKGHSKQIWKRQDWKMKLIKCRLILRKLIISWHLDHVTLGKRFHSFPAKARFQRDDHKETKIQFRLTPMLLKTSLM